MKKGFMLFTRMQGGESSLLSNLFRLKKEKNKEGKDKECWIIRLLLRNNEHSFRYFAQKALGSRRFSVGSIAPKYVGAASPKMAIAPKCICEINGEY